MKYITFVTSIALAVVAGYFSIVGLSTIFAGAVVSVIVMASILEVAKLVTAAYLHLEWHRINALTRIYLTTAVLVLMLITSMGIFGYLSKAHIEQTIKVGGTNALQLEQIERKLSRQQEIIRDSESVIAQLDSAVETLMEYDRIRGDEGALAVRASQKQERESLNQQIDEAYAEIERLESEATPLRKDQLNLEAEIGPLKYIAEAVYGRENARDHFDAAVRWIILILVCVFDPLAVVLLIVSTGEFKRDKLDKASRSLVDTNQIMIME